MTDYPKEPAPAPVDQIWHLRASTPERVGINAIEAWRTTQGGDSDDPDNRKGVKVVIFDVGVETRHPALQPNLCLDDARNFDASISGEGDGSTTVDNRIDAHGTACAGIVGATRTAEGNMVPATKPAGVAPRCLIVPIRISTNFDRDVLLKALDQADSAGHVVLIPRFLPEDEALAAKVTDMAQRKPVVCAAGNDGTSRLIFPASLPDVIAVGACNDQGWRSTYSQYGKPGERGVDVVAPSNDVPIEDRTLTRLDVEAVASRVRDREEREVRLADRVADRLAKDYDDRATAVREYAREKRRNLDRLDALDSALGRCGARDLADGHRETVSAVYEYARDNKLNLDRMGTLAIATTDNLGASGYCYDPAGDYCRAEGDFGFGGTSAAAAQVAGVVALMLAAKPELMDDAGAVREILHQTAQKDVLKPEAPRGERDLEKGTDEWASRFAQEFGHGLVDAARAVQVAQAWYPGADVAALVARQAPAAGA